jgi:hypothetical protein
MNLRMGWVSERPFIAASKLAGPTAAASCTQSTVPDLRGLPAACCRCDARSLLRHESSGGLVNERPSIAASKLAGPTAAASCTQSTVADRAKTWGNFLVATNFGTILSVWHIPFNSGSMLPATSASFVCRQEYGGA